MSWRQYDGNATSNGRWVQIKHTKGLNKIIHTHFKIQISSTRSISPHHIQAMGAAILDLRSMSALLFCFACSSASAHCTTTCVAMVAFGIRLQHIFTDRCLYLILYSSNTDGFLRNNKITNLSDC